MNTKFEIPKDEMGNSRVDYVVIFIVLLYWLGVILQVLS